MRAIKVNERQAILLSSGEKETLIVPKNGGIETLYEVEFSNNGIERLPKRIYINITGIEEHTNYKISDDLERILLSRYNVELLRPYKPGIFSITTRVDGDQISLVVKEADKITSKIIILTFDKDTLEREPVLERCSCKKTVLTSSPSFWGEGLVLTPRQRRGGSRGSHQRTH